MTYGNTMATKKTDIPNLTDNLNSRDTTSDKT